ncbi:hypothetical protein MHYP_G00186080 [Metynnis hypsauchen]
MTFYRTGWRGRRRTEGSRVECTPPRTDSNADRGRAAGVRGKNHQEKRKTPPETPRPTTDSHQQRITETHDRRQRTQQVFVERPSSEQDIDQSNAVPYTMTFYRTGWRGRRRTEGSRVECTPPRTDSNAHGGEKRGGKPRPKKPHWYQHDNRV